MKKWNKPGQFSEYKGLYQSWVDMHKRAGNRNGEYPTYIDVTVCDRWLSYDNFFEDMADTWFKGATLDKDSILPGNRVYCKEYCKWITRSENSKERNDRLGSPMTEEARIKITGENNIFSKKVQCIETGKIYANAREAADELGFAQDSVRRVCRNERKTAGGYHWKFLEE